jgi:hypothetical protein
LNELCNGRPSEETVQFLRSLERPLDAPSEEITRLFGETIPCSALLIYLIQILNNAVNVLCHTYL